MTTAASASEYDRLMQSYIYWVVLRQVEPDPFGDPRIEPKFEIPSGAVYNGSWCRPQNDGPGLRAITLIECRREGRAMCRFVAQKPRL